MVVGIIVYTGLGLIIHMFTLITIITYGLDTLVQFEPALNIYMAYFVLYKSYDIKSWTYVD